MKTSGGLVVVAAVAALALQGCAGGGALKYAPGAQPGATANPSAAAMPVVTGIQDKSSFEAVQAAIEQQMQPGKRFSSVDAAGRATVDGRFKDMATLFDQYGSFDKMGPDAQARVNDDQNAINAVLAPRDGNRLICHDEMPVGSHLPQRVCRTLSQIQNEKNNAQQGMHAMQNRSNVQNGGH